MSISTSLAQCPFARIGQYFKTRSSTKTFTSWALTKKWKSTGVKTNLGLSPNNLPQNLNKFNQKKLQPTAVETKTCRKREDALGRRRSLEWAKIKMSMAKTSQTTTLPQSNLRMISHVRKESMVRKVKLFPSRLGRRIKTIWTTTRKTETISMVIRKTMPLRRYSTSRSSLKNSLTRSSLRTQIFSSRSLWKGSYTTSKRSIVCRQSSCKLSNRLLCWGTTLNWKESKTKCSRCSMLMRCWTIIICLMETITLKPKTSYLINRLSKTQGCQTFKIWTMIRQVNFWSWGRWLRQSRGRSMTGSRLNSWCLWK